MESELIRNLDVEIASYKEAIQNAEEALASAEFELDQALNELFEED